MSLALSHAREIRRVPPVPFKSVALSFNRSISVQTVIEPSGPTEVSQLLAYWGWRDLAPNPWSKPENLAPQLVVVSTELPTGITSTLATAGIIGLCTNHIGSHHCKLVLIHPCCLRFGRRAGGRPLPAHGSDGTASQHHIPRAARSVCPRSADANAYKLH